MLRVEQLIALIATNLFFYHLKYKKVKPKREDAFILLWMKKRNKQLQVHQIIFK